MEKDDKPLGTIDLRVRYDKAQKYEGELPSSRDLDLAPPAQRRVDFYRGKCATTNLFSVWDSSAKGQTFKAVESFYRDNKFDGQ